MIEQIRAIFKVKKVMETVTEDNMKILIKSAAFIDYMNTQIRQAEELKIFLQKQQAELDEKRKLAGL